MAEVTQTAPLAHPRTVMHVCTARSPRPPLGSNFFHQEVGDRFGHPFLDLRTAGDALNDPGQLAQPYDRPLGR